MNKPIFAVLLFLFILNAMPAQDVYITGSIGWRFAGNFGTGYIVDDSYGEDEFVIDEAVNFTLIGNFPIHENMELDISIDHENTKIRSEGEIPLAPFTTFNITQAYYHVGAIWVSSSLTSDFYFGGTLGVSHLNPGDSFESAYFFSFGPKVGARYPISQFLGIDVHSRAIFTTMNGSEGIFARDGVPQFYFDGKILVQINFSIGLVFTL